MSTNQHKQASTPDADNSGELRTMSGQGIISERDLNGLVGSCRDCGYRVADYLCNSDLIAKRIEAKHWDWWVACTNTECKNHHGEGVFQDDPPWMIRGPAPTPAPAAVEAKSGQAIAHTLDGEPLFEIAPPKGYKFPEAREGKRWAYVGKGPKGQGRFMGRFAGSATSVAKFSDGWHLFHGNSMIKHWGERTRYIVEVDAAPPAQQSTL